MDRFFQRRGLEKSANWPPINCRGSRFVQAQNKIEVTFENDPLSAASHFGPFANGRFDVAENFFGVLGRNRRPDGGGRVHRVPDLHLFGLPDKLGQELVVDSALDKHSGAVGTNLSLKLDIFNASANFA